MLKIKKRKKEMYNEIERFVINKKCTYIDAVILYCELNQIEVEQAASMVSGNEFIKAKIQDEAENLNLIRKEEEESLIA